MNISEVKIGTAKEVKYFGYREIDLSKLDIIVELDRDDEYNQHVETLLCKKCNVSKNNHYGFRITLQSDQVYYILFEDTEVWIGLPYLEENKKEILTGIKTESELIQFIIDCMRDSLIPNINILPLSQDFQGMKIKSSINKTMLVFIFDDPKRTVTSGTHFIEYDSDGDYVLSKAGIAWCKEFFDDNIIDNIKFKNTVAPPRFPGFYSPHDMRVEIEFDAKTICKKIGID